MEVRFLFEGYADVGIGENEIKEMILDDVNIENEKEIKEWILYNVDWKGYEDIDEVEYEYSEFINFLNKFKREKEELKIIEESKPLVGQISLFEED